MDFNQLDQYLRTYTTHEVDYLNKFNQHESLIFYPKETHLDLFDIKKNSRFLPVAEHNHDYIEMNYVYSGTIQQTINTTTLTLNQNDILILDTQVQHSIMMAHENDIMLAFRFSKDYFINNFFKDFNTDNPISDFLLKSLFESQKYQQYLRFNISEAFDLQKIIQLLIIEFIQNRATFDIIKHHYISIIFEKFLELYRTKLQIDSRTNKKTRLNFKLLNYLETHYQSVTLNTIAKDFNYTPCYLSSLIKKQTGKTFSQHILDIRFKNALILIENTPLTNAQICEEVGFTNLNAFYKTCQLRLGCSPNQYRKQHSS